MDIEVVLLTIMGPLILLFGFIAMLIYFLYDKDLSHKQRAFVTILATPLCITMSVLLCPIVFVITLVFAMYHGLKYIFIKLK